VFVLKATIGLQCYWLQEVIGVGAAEERLGEHLCARKARIAKE
jgi:hypothetical protein